MRNALIIITADLEKLTSELTEHPDTPASDIIETLDLAVRRLHMQLEMIEQGLDS